MITKVVLGWRVGGLIAYLMGPGRAQEHVNPRVIATWDGRDAAWQPQANDAAAGRELGPLIRALQAPAVAAGLEERAKDGRRGFVWHCSARVAAEDRVLSDAEWADVARELLDGAGVAGRDDVGGPRWAAIRHADDHIHIAVVLVRQDTSRRFWPFQDYPRLRETARRIEQRLGLTLTASADGTAARAPRRGELEKAHRQGREPARRELARVVREAAVAASGLGEFVAELERGGYRVEVRRAPSGDPLGYKIARLGDVTAAGEPVFYSGSKLAPDLSLPRLVRAWAAGEGSGMTEPMSVARRRVDAARRAVGAARHGHADEDPDGLAHAAHSVLTALRGNGPAWADAADRFDRAARAPRGATVRAGAQADGLVRVARQLVRRRQMLGVSGEPAPAAVALAVALAALLQEIAAWQRDRGRGHQAEAALVAADTLRAAATGSTTPPIDGLIIPSRTVGMPTTPRPHGQPRRDHATPQRS